MSGEHGDAGSTPGLAQWVKDLLLQLQLRSQPQLRSDPWPGKAKNERKKKEQTSGSSGSSLVAQHVKEDLAWSLHWLRSLPWGG